MKQLKTDFNSLINLQFKKNGLTMKKNDNNSKIYGCAVQAGIKRLRQRRQ